MKHITNISDKRKCDKSKDALIFKKYQNQIALRLQRTHLRSLLQDGLMLDGQNTTDGII